MKRFLPIIGLPVLFFYLAGCSVANITERPEKETEALSLAPLESHIALSANINLQKLQSDFNDSLPSPITEFKGSRGGCWEIKVLTKKVSVGCKWNVLVKKRNREKATITGANQNLHFAVPLRVRAKVRPTNVVLKIVSKILVPRPIKTNFTVTANSSPWLDPDWSLDLNLATDFKWNKRPTIKLLGFIPIRISSKIEPEIRKGLKKVEKQIKAEIENMNIRGKAIQAWEKAHVPIKLSGDPELWLRLKPKAVRFSGFHTQNNVLAASVSMYADMETVLGERPDPFPVSPLPALGERDQETGPFLVRLPMVLEYETLKKEIEKVLRVGQKWAPIRDKPNHYVNVQEVEVYPAKENIVLGVNFIADLPDQWLDTRGKVYFQGKPVIDNEQRMVTVENFGFTRTTDNALINVASLLFRKRIQNELSSALAYRFGDEHDKLINAANFELNRDFGDGLRGQGALHYAKVDKVVMLERGIYLSVVSEGTLQLKFGL